MAKHKAIVIGIDGGGSRTRGVLFQGDKELAQRETGTARVGSIGLVESCERLLNLIRDLCTAANVSAKEIDAVAIGLAGVWLREEQMRSQQLLNMLARERKVEFDELVVTSDAAIALQGAFNGENGIVLIVGTGTIAIGKTPDGAIVRCGGWGIELSDEGSGAWIGKKGLTAIARSFDGRGKKTALADMLMQFFPIIRPEQPRTLVAAFNEKVFDYPSIAPMVMECAVADDEVCLEIIQRAADNLMEMLDVLYRTNFSKEKKVSVACVGGIMESDTILARIMAERLAKHKHLHQVKPLGTPLAGAISLAETLLLADDDY